MRDFADQVSPETVAPSPEAAAPTVDATRASTRSSGLHGSLTVQAKLVVGGADDPAENEADQIAQQVMRLLRSPMSFEGANEQQPRVQSAGERAAPIARVSSSRIRSTGGQPAPIGRISSPDTRIRRMVAPIGAEGGTVDNDTEREIQTARSGGAPLEGKIRRRMEDAMGADFSAVRVHVGAKSDQLNERIQAKAFTAGADIFVRRSEYAPDTTAGQQLLAHELTHTVQQGASPQTSPSAPAGRGEGADVARSFRQGRLVAQRSSELIQRWEWPWAKKKKELEISGPIGMVEHTASGSPDHNMWNAEFGKGGDSQLGPGRDVVATQPDSMRPAGWAGPAPEGPAYAGSGGAETMAASGKMEAGKPAAVVAAGLAAGGAVAGGVDSGGGAWGGAVAGGSFVAPVAGNVIGGAGTAAAAADVYAGYAERSEGQQYGDKAQQQLGTNRMQNSGVDVGQGTMGLTQGAIATAHVAENVAHAQQMGQNMGQMAASAQVATDFAQTAAGGAGAVLGMATGSVQVVQGTWRGGKAAMHVCRLALGRGATMLSQRGEKWKSAVLAAEGARIGINMLKVAVGALGIAGGALLIASNPIGWSIGIAAGVAGGIYAITKIAGKISNARDKANARARIESGESLRTVGADFTDDPVPEADDSTVDPEMRAKRLEAIEKANLVAREASANARTAHEMIMALKAGTPDSQDIVQQYLDIMADPTNAGQMPAEEGLHHAAILKMMMGATGQEFHDSTMILSSIGVDSETALSDSAQELIAKKMSKTEAM